MAITGVGAVGDLLFQMGDRIHGLGAVWYKSSAAWADFPRLLNNLRQKHYDLLPDLTKFGLLQDNALMAEFQEASSALGKEEARLNKLASGCGARYLCWSQFYRTVFPDRVTSCLQTLIDALEEIPRRMPSQEESREVAMRRKFINRPLSFRIFEDNLYVHVSAMERAVIQALEDPEGPHVVLLHGGPGSGKSTLARQTALRIREEADRRSGGAPTVQCQSESQSCKFEHVFYLECGRRAEAGAKQLELLQLLGFEEPSCKEGDEQFGRAQIPICKQLTSLLKDQALLVILDDVWESTFVQTFVDLVGVGVRCLITSQDPNLWKQARSIEMENLTMEDAKKVLASHAGLSESIIPNHLEAIATRMVTEMEANPLALASLATAINKRRPTEVDEWRDAERSLMEMLHVENAAASILNKKYPRSFWSSMKASVESVSKEARTLLLLVSLCDQPSVPEDVVRILSENLKPQGAAKLNNLRNNLEDRSLLGVGPHPLLWEFGSSHKRCRSWSLHDLQRQLLRQEMSDELNSIVSSLLHDAGDSVSMVNNPDEMVMAICGLYFGKAVAKRAAANLGIPDSNFSAVRRTAIEPIIWLSQAPTSNNWSQASSSVARQAFLRYVCDDELDDDCITHLLVRPYSTKATCWAILSINRITEKPLLGGKSHGIMTALVYLLGEERGRKQREKALMTVTALACKHYHRGLMVNFPGLLERLVGLLAYNGVRRKGGNPHNEKRYALYVLMNLSADVQSRTTIVDFPGALAGIFGLLHEYESVLIQIQATRVLQNLCMHDQQNKRKIAEFPGGLTRLVALLSKHPSPRVQIAVAHMLDTLSSSNQHNRKKIGQFPGAMAGLITLLSEHHTPPVQIHAAKVLENLSYGDHANKRKIAELPFALASLVGLLSERNHHEVQIQATQVLGTLSVDDVIARKIVEFNGALEGLVNLLSSEQNSLDVQLRAAWVLRNLSYHEPNRRKIADFPGALAGIVGLLTEHDVEPIQIQATKVLENLCSHNQQNKRKIAEFPGALTTLVELLSKHESSRVQIAAAHMLGTLCSSNQQNRRKIGQISGAIAGLTTLLSENSTPAVQIQAAKVLESLSYGNHQNKRKIVEIPYALARLVGLLSKHNHHEVQILAAQVLGTLACDVEPGKQILEFPGALEGLVKLLSSEHKNLHVQLRAARVLRNLSYHEPNLSKIGAIPGALAGLVSLLPELTNHGVKIYPASALAMLSCNDENIKAIAEIPDALPGLIGLLLSEDAGDLLQMEAARGLANLSYRNENKRTILQYPGALAEFVKMLFRHDHPDLQMEGARALAYLSNEKHLLPLMGEDSDSEKFPENLSGLMKFLSKHKTPDAQKVAASRLARLSYGDHNKSTIAEFPGALYGLVALLFQHEQPLVQKTAAWALANFNQGLEINEEEFHFSPCRNVDGSPALLQAQACPAPAS